MKRPNEHSRLGGYLNASLTLGTLVTSTHAAVVTLDVSSFSGLNGGVPSGQYDSFSLSSLHPSLSGIMEIYNGEYSFFGLDGDSGMRLAVNSLANVSPKNFPMGSPIDNTSIFSGAVNYTAFKGSGSESPDFGPGSYMGFRVDAGAGDYHYGWLEVTWDSATDTFQILSGAFESDLNTPILAGSGAISAIPEPSSALGTLGILAAGMMIRRRGKKAA